MSPLRLNGSTSGFSQLDAPAIAGNNSITLPAGNGTANQFLKNSSTAGTLGWSSMVEDSSGRVLVGVSSANANGGILQLSSGITFPATQVLSTDPNTLDDYEEGTWTPVISDGTNNATMNTAGGISRYTKVGNQITCVAFVSTTSLGSVGGNIRVNGLPFSNGAQYCTVTCGWAENLNITAGRVLGGWVPQNLNYIVLTIWSQAIGTNNLTTTDWSSDGGAMFSFSYLT